MHTLRTLSATLLVLVALAVIPGQRAQAAACDRSAGAISSLTSARGPLLAIPRSDDDPDPTLPEAAQRGIERLKDAVAELVEARMRCAATGDDATAIAKDLALAVRELPGQCDAACRKAARGDENPYRDVPDFDAKAWPQQRLAIVARIPIVCGSDAMLFVYERVGSAWQRRVRWRSPPYKEVSGAFEAFDYTIAAPDERGDWYVLTKSIKPWCSSTWSQIRYAALRPSADAARVVLQSEDSIWWGGDDLGAIAAQPHAFDVRFHAESIDDGVHNRVWIRHFTIDGDRVQRVQPVALNPRDFVDEWIRSDWGLASAWSDPDSTALQGWHERLRGKGSPFYEFDGVHACKGVGHAVQIAIVASQDDARYFLRVAGSGPYTLKGVAKQGDARCGGKDLSGTMDAR